MERTSQIVIYICNHIVSNSYKAISKIKIGDRVINMHGSPVNVIGHTFQGRKRVFRFKSSMWKTAIYVTTTHKYYTAFFDEEKGLFRKNWNQIYDAALENEFTTMPANIQFDTNSNTIDFNRIAIYHDGIYYGNY